jgi:hypothetical protein
MREMGRAASEIVRRDWTYGRTAEVIEGLVKKVKPKERVEVEERSVVVWKGDPRNVTTKVGGFVRGVPRPLTARQMELLGTDSRFSREIRYRRIGSV